MTCFIEGPNVTNNMLRPAYKTGTVCNFVLAFQKELYIYIYIMVGPDAMGPRFPFLPFLSTPLP